MSAVPMSFAVTLPTTRIDGTDLPLSYITSVKIVQGFDGVTFPTIVSVGVPGSPVFTRNMPVETDNGTFFSAIVKTAEGQESALAVAAEYVILAAPSAPSIAVS